LPYFQFITIPFEKQIPLTIFREYDTVLSSADGGDGNWRFLTNTEGFLSPFGLFVETTNPVISAFAAA
jgi:hypothetical protein